MKHYQYLLLFCSFLQNISCTQSPIFGVPPYQVTKEWATKSCSINFLLDSNNQRFVVKQIKSEAPHDQVSLVMDVVGCTIAAAVPNLPINRVTLIAPGIPFPGKNKIDLPATLHTFVGGGNKQAPRLKNIRIDIWQGRPQTDHDLPFIRKKYHAIPDNRTGLSLTAITSMALHPDLPAIAALDTFLGNPDRVRLNLLYDQKKKQFSAIDCGDCFYGLLGKYSFDQLTQLVHNQHSFTVSQKVALRKYRDTLNIFLAKFTPQEIEQIIDQQLAIGGFTPTGIWSPTVATRIAFHKTILRTNYTFCLKMIPLLTELIS